MSRVVDWEHKNVAERLRRGFELTLFCARFWKPEIYVPQDYVLRPVPALVGGLRADGHQYRSLNAGVTGKSEPRWQAGTVQDAGVQWEREPVSAASLYRSISDPFAIEWIPEPGSNMTIDSPQVVLGPVVQIAAFHSGGIEGNIHRVIVRVPFDDGAIEDFERQWTITEDNQ